jgi:plastocyanin
LIKKTLILPLLAVAAIAAGCGSGSSTSSAGYGEPTAAATGTAAPEKSAAQAPADNDAAPAADDATTDGGGATDDAAKSDAAAAPIAVDIADFAFAPKAIQAKVGQTITFTNKDSAPHTATATEGAKFDSGQLDQGKSFSYTAKKAGTIQFVCSFHPNMTGTITVS